jgi:phosphopantothenoylcysteine decarboxylase/phosphopantothenate--cysteine ligase
MRLPKVKCSGRKPRQRINQMARGENIILGVTASIAIYKSCDIVRRLKQAGFSVNVVMTKEAEELVRPIVFQSLSENKVHSGLFEAPEAWGIEHVSLADKASLVLIAPATANIIGKIASGIADDLLTCVVCATSAPVLICPAMNENMFKNKITQENIKKLKILGYRFVEPRTGKLACGKTGVGCLAEVETIISSVKKILH